MENVERDEFQLKIWTKIIDTQMHFNEMLIRMRTIGLSIVITIIGAGVVTQRPGGNDTHFEVGIGTFLILFALVNLLCGYLLKQGMHNHSFLKSTSHTEKNSLLFVYFIPWFVWLYFIFKFCSSHLQYVSIPIGVFISSGGLLLLISLYLLDRFYYYELLLGAVEQGHKIESKHEQFSLTNPLSERVTKFESSKIVTVYYMLPALGAMAVIFGWLIYSNRV
jgi:hypothetical protein